MLPLFISFTSSGEKLKKSNKLILCDHVRNPHSHSVLQSIEFYKEKFHAGHSQGLKG